MPIEEGASACAQVAILAFGYLAHLRGNRLRHIPRPTLLRIDGQHAHRALIRATQQITHDGRRIGLGWIGTLGWVMLVNRDPTNYVEVKTATSGTIFARLEPAGGFCLFKCGSGVTAPYAIANTAACVIEKFVGSL
jgi:hypothetical protein